MHTNPCPSIPTSHPLPRTLPQAAGFYQHYGDNLVFATVRNAGHMVPSTQPARAFELLRRFMNTGTLASQEDLDPLPAPTDV